MAAIRKLPCPEGRSLTENFQFFSYVTLLHRDWEPLYLQNYNHGPDLELWENDEKQADADLDLWTI